MTPLLPIHVAAASLALVTGVIALSAKKGGWLHRKSGVVFVYAMLAMSASALVAALIRGQVTNVIAALTTAYLVATGLLTVRRGSVALGRWDVGLMAGAFLLGVTCLTAAIVAFASPSHTIFGFPFFPFLLFAVLSLSGAAGDLRVIRSGALRAGRRLARHLWRMCMGLFIAAASFFSIRARVAAIFPESLTTPLARAVPVILVLVAMVYWLWRLRLKSRAIPARS
jgi:uncharacterized membrane protein